MPAQSMLLDGGQRLHLQHGPIDLIIGADGDRDTAFRAANARFATVLDELVSELPALRQQMSCAVPRPVGNIARRMDNAVRPLASEAFVTRMAAVAGAVADAVLDAMTDAADLRRAYVNNGGDISVHLTCGEHFVLAIGGSEGQDLGRVTMCHDDEARGIATSGRHGRSLSRGVADSVTVLARSAAAADVAATLIANAVDLPGNPAVTRVPASTLVEDSDLGARTVVTGCDPLTPTDRALALDAGLQAACGMKERGLIQSAALFLQGDVRITEAAPVLLDQRMHRYG